jgi:hypothetical protein
VGPNTFTVAVVTGLLVLPEYTVPSSVPGPVPLELDVEGEVVAPLEEVEVEVVVTLEEVEVDVGVPLDEVEVVAPPDELAAIPVEVDPPVEAWVLEVAVELPEALPEVEIVVEVLVDVVVAP